MKFYVDTYEVYPVYSFTKVPPSNKYSRYEVDLDEDLVKEYQERYLAFMTIYEQIYKLLDD